MFAFLYIIFIFFLVIYFLIHSLFLFFKKKAAHQPSPSISQVTQDIDQQFAKLKTDVFRVAKERKLMAKQNNNSNFNKKTRSTELTTPIK